MVTAETIVVETSFRELSRSSLYTEKIWQISASVFVDDHEEVTFWWQVNAKMNTGRDAKPFKLSFPATQGPAGVAFANGVV
jgi:hypothetical protein